MQEFTDINFIAWWGACLSTLLAIIKLWELWKDRFRIDVGRNLTSESEIGNQIYIRNLSSKPIILEYWQLQYYSRGWFFGRLEDFESPGEDAADIQILPHSSQVLSFTRQHHFDWRHKTLNGRSIYIKLHIAGRRPIHKKIYG